MASGKPWIITPLIGGKGSPIRIFGIVAASTARASSAARSPRILPADQLSDLWASLALGPESTVALMREDGQIVTRYPAPDEPTSIADNELFTNTFRSAPSGVYRASTTPVDGKPRIVAYESLKDLGLAVGASVLQTHDKSAIWSRVGSTSLVAAPVFSPSSSSASGRSCCCCATIGPALSCRPPSPRTACCSRKSIIG